MASAKYELTQLLPSPVRCETRGNRKADRGRFRNGSAEGPDPTG